MSGQRGPTHEPGDEPERVDPQWWLRPSDVVAVVAAHGQTRPSRGPRPPLTPAELAAHAHDLTDARGQRPTLTPANRAEVEAAAARLLAALRVAVP